MSERIPNYNLGFCIKCSKPFDNHAFDTEGHILCPTDAKRLRYAIEFEETREPPWSPFDDPLGPMPV